MKNKFLLGFLKGILYYAIGFIIAWFTFLIFGWGYIHTPGLHHIVGFLFLIGGIGWTIYYLAVLLTGLKSKINFGILTAHVVTILSVILYFIVSISTDEVTNTKTDPKDIITIIKDEKTNEASIVNGYGDTLYSKKGDSIFIDNNKK